MPVRHQECHFTENNRHRFAWHTYSPNYAACMWRGCFHDADKYFFCFLKPGSLLYFGGYLTQEYHFVDYKPDLRGAGKPKKSAACIWKDRCHGADVCFISAEYYGIKHLCIVCVTRRWHGLIYLICYRMFQKILSRYISICWESFSFKLVKILIVMVARLHTIYGIIR